MNKGMNMGTLVGVFGAMAMVIGSIILSGNSLGAFIDIPSLLLVLVGSYFALMIAFALTDSLGVFAAIGLTFKQPVFDTASIIQKMIAFSEKARREGLLALEDELEDLEDEFMKKRFAPCCRRNRPDNYPRSYGIGTKPNAGQTFIQD